jgi:dTDP-4-dehydrorhamnose 3,5-epimerase-like enzyme
MAEKILKEECHMIENCKLIEFSQNGDERGQLVIVEGNKDIPFDIKRVFYIYGSDKDVVRGRHANYNTEFVLINVAGTSKVKVDDGQEQRIFNLDRPHIGIYLPKLIWKDMYDFSEDSVLLCLASEHYDANEYIRNYDEYLKVVNNNYEKLS